jgi:DNA-binding beta-propeller fold protein YncE
MIDLQTNAATVMNTRSGARVIALDARGQVYTATGGGVEVIDPEQARVVLTLPLGGRNPWSVAVHPTTGEIYIGDANDGTVRAAPAVDASKTLEWR